MNAVLSRNYIHCAWTVSWKYDAATLGDVTGLVPFGVAIAAEMKTTASGSAKAPYDNGGSSPTQFP